MFGHPMPELIDQQGTQDKSLIWSHAVHTPSPRDESLLLSAQTEGWKGSTPQWNHSCQLSLCLPFQSDFLTALGRTNFFRKELDKYINPKDLD